MARDLGTAEAAVNKYVTKAITQAQFNALVSFAYNLGIYALKDSSLLLHINNTQPTRKDFTVYSKARDQKTGMLVTLPGLLKRRNEEATLYGLA